ncbi:4-vinyl reductase 4VR [Methanocaldococcus vulcanius M7]|uniref:4-vinyl reductase 4VR n=1 Tax=Methanocaldococcus vulcanius (strain ATCC 700851 / DSM 12094 / M7) TaxID=579137 RepID=C9RI63_METVM|nr:V4R domain-containing protein [Methanocaldococcus vulcanius]ACX73265.1 4-vinyl reductase 4VR [Methanocaldococcus vulcanius M7]
MEKIFPEILEVIRDENKLKNAKKIPIPYFGLMAIELIDTVKELNSEISLYEIGYKFGKLMSPNSLDELVKLFRLMNFGELKIDLERRIIEHYSPPYNKKCSEPIHDFIAGILAGALKNIFSKNNVVKEIKCTSIGEEKCVYEILFF